MKHAVKKDTIGFIIPANCMHVRIVDFKEPCRQIDSVYMMCNQVKVEVLCVGVKK